MEKAASGISYLIVSRAEERVPGSWDHTSKPLKDGLRGEVTLATDLNCGQEGTRTSELCEEDSILLVLEVVL